MYKLLEYLKIFDIYGQRVTLSFNSQEQCRTTVGGVFSLAIILIVIIFFYSDFDEFIQKENLTARSQKFVENNPSILTLTNSDFMFAVQIDQDNFTANPFFNISVEQRHYQRATNGSLTKTGNYIDLVPCQLSHFQRIFEKYNKNFTNEFSLVGLSNFLCPNLDIEKQREFIIQGQYSSEHFSFIKFSVTTCFEDTNNNFSWKPKCKTKQEIQKELKSEGNFRFKLYTTNYLINEDDPTNYIEPYLAIDQFYTFIPDSMFIQSDIYVQQVIVQTDNNIFLNGQYDIEKLSYRQYGDMRPQISINQLTPDYFGAFYLQRSVQGNIKTRKFLKIDQFLSQLGGFIQIVIMIIGLFVINYNKQKMALKIANDLYEFNKNQRKDQALLDSVLLDVKQLRKSDKSIQDVYKQPVNRHCPMVAKNTEDNIKNINLDSKPIEIMTPKQQLRDKILDKLSLSNYLSRFQDIFKKKLQIKFSIRMFFSLVLPCKFMIDDETLLINRAIEQVQKELDITFIINKLHEMQKLKHVLLNKDQLTLFNFIEKPTISLIKDRSTKKKKTIIHSQVRDKDQLANFKVAFDTLVNAYEKLNQSHDVIITEQEFNKRLFNLIGKDLLSILQKSILSSISIQDSQQF